MSQNRTRHNAQHNFNGQRWTEAEDRRIETELLACTDRIERGAAIRQLAVALGRTEEAVKNRLGWLRKRNEVLRACKSARVAKQSGKPVPRYSTRTCLCCERQFRSEGPHNRLCHDCRRREVSPYAP